MITVPDPATRIMLVILIAALAIIPFVGDTYAVKLVTRMIVFAIFGISLDLLIGYTGLVSFGHAAFFGLAAYSLQLLSPETDATNILIALPAALLIVAGAAVLIGALVVRTKGIYFIMVTLAFAQMLYFIFHDTTIAGGSDGAYIWIKPVLAAGEIVIVDFDNRSTLYFFSLACLIICYVGLVVILRSPFGEVIQGIKVNEHRMRALGYNTYAFKLVAFVLSATIAGFAGFLFACIDGYVSPDLLGWQESGIGLVIVILGGMGTLFGPVLGAIAFIGVEELFRDRAVTGPLADHWQILMGAFVIAVVLVLKNGLAGIGWPSIRRLKAWDKVE